MLDVQYTSPSLWGINWKNPESVRQYLASQNKAIERLVEEIRQKGGNPKYIKINGLPLDRLVKDSAPWPGELKLFTGSMAQARAWGRKYGWTVADGSGGLDLRHKFLRGTDKTASAGGISGGDTHTHAHTLAIGNHSNHTHSHTPSGTIGGNSGSICVAECAGGTEVSTAGHSHTFSGSSSATGNESGALTHSFSGSITNAAAGSGALPSYYEVIILVKGQWKA